MTVCRIDAIVSDQKRMVKSAGMTLRQFTRLLSCYGSGEQVLIDSAPFAVYDIQKTEQGINLRLTAPYLGRQRWRPINTWIDGQGWRPCLTVGYKWDIMMCSNEQWFRVADDNRGIEKIYIQPIYWLEL